MGEGKIVLAAGTQKKVLLTSLQSFITDAILLASSVKQLYSLETEWKTQKGLCGQRTLLAIWLARINRLWWYVKHFTGCEIESQCRMIAF